MKNALVVIWAAAAIVAAAAMCARRPAEVIEIPDGFRGWVEVTYSPACPEAPQTADGHRLLRVGRDGRLCVGSPWIEGGAADEFWYVSDRRRTQLHEETPGTGMIWDRSTRQPNLSNVRIDRFFVGTETEYRGQFK